LPEAVIGKSCLAGAPATPNSYSRRNAAQNGGHAPSQYQFSALLSDWLQIQSGNGIDSQVSTMLDRILLHCSVPSDSRSGDEKAAMSAVSK
jgi:hypothetical protein